MSYDFSVLRETRKRQNLTINELSHKCGVSYVALSKLERNQGNPELRTLDRICRALGMAAHHLLAMADQQRPVQTAEQTCRIFGKGTCRFVDLEGTRVLVIRAPKGASGTAPEFHGDDYERCFVLDGRVRICVRDAQYILGPGQGLVWDSQFEHSYEAVESSTFVKVLTPKRP
jgi:transcriptional regulator with XRE-family HTH domain